MIKLLRSWTGQILTRIYITSFQSEWKNMTNSPTDFKLPPVIDVVPVPAISRSGALTRIKMKAAFMAINMMSVQCRSARNILTDSSLLGDGDLECWGKKWKAQKYELPLWICHQIRLLFPKYAHRTIPPVTPYPSGWTGSNRTAALLIASVSRRSTVNSFRFLKHSPMCHIQRSLRLCIMELSDSNDSSGRFTGCTCFHLVLQLQIWSHRCIDEKL